MSANQGQPGSSAGDTYDLAVSLRQRLAESARPQSTSVASQLQLAARARLGSKDALGGKDRSRLRLRRRPTRA
jgi:hypothetical protein